MKGSDSSKPSIIVVAGPTGSGKSAIAVELAKRLDGEIVSADSMQVYRYMDIGTAKPTPDEMAGIPHHMIDIVNPDEEFSASDYREAASAVIDEITKREKRVIVCGGTGLYIRALTGGLVDTPEGDPSLREELRIEAEKSGRKALHERLRALDRHAAAAIHPNNLIKVIRALEVAILSDRKISEVQKEHLFGDTPYRVMMLGIEWEREVLYGRIEERVDRMIESGLVEEVKRLLAMGYSRDLKPMRGVGYKEISAHLLEGLPLGEAVELIKRDSRRYAKRQLTWFRKEKIQWKTFAGHLSDENLRQMECFLDSAGIK